LIARISIYPQVLKSVPQRLKAAAHMPATTLYGTVALSFVIGSVPGFPTSPLSPVTTYVVLPKENHMQLTEAATLDRKSGGAEGSAVQRTFRGDVFLESAAEWRDLRFPQGTKQNG
jgi:hypothetical protein